MEGTPANQRRAAPGAIRPLLDIAGRTLDTLGWVKWLVFALLILGAAFIGAGWKLEDEGYVSSAALEVGAALLLAVPLIVIERLMEDRISSFQQTAEESLQDVRSEVETVRRDVHTARTEIEQLGRATADRIEATRAADAARAQALRDEVSETNAWNLLYRAEELGATSRAGVRVPIPDSELRVRFTLVSGQEDDDHGHIRLGIESPAGDECGRPVEWMPNEPGEQALARLWEELARAGAGDITFDAEVVVRRLADMLEATIEVRNGARKGVPLDCVLEVAGDWAITYEGFASLRERGRRVGRERLLRQPDRVRAELLDGVPDSGFADLFRTALDYHAGEDRRAAVRRVPESR